MFGYGGCNAGSALATPGVNDAYRETALPRIQEWYALAVKPRHDKAVSRTLENKGYQTFVPLYTKRHHYAARFKETDLPLFPGYVFCRFNPRTKLPVVTTPGVIQILGAGHVPIPVDETEIASLQTALKLQLPVQPFPFLEAGQRVRIAEGALAGIEGVVMSTKQYLRLVVSITLLRRSVLLEIDRDCVRPESMHAPSTLGLRHDHV
jgi:transcription antitermination factor NusG